MTRTSIRRSLDLLLFSLFALLATSAYSASFSNIENLGSWDTCADCAGSAYVDHSVWLGISSPSLTGASAQFNIDGNIPYGDALWWKQLGGNDGASNFTYDLYFYIKDPGASQALEFDVNQSAGGRKYIFGTQCGVNYDHQWDVWDPAGGTWRSTGLPCNVNAWSWNHLTWQFNRSNGWVHYISVTLNGVTYNVNRWYDSIGSGVSEINVAFQMDQTAAHVPYSVWVDKISLNYW